MIRAIITKTMSDKKWPKHVLRMKYDDNNQMQIIN